MPTVLKVLEIHQPRLNLTISLLSNRSRIRWQVILIVISEFCNAHQRTKTGKDFSDEGGVRSLVRMGFTTVSMHHERKIQLLSHVTVSASRSLSLSLPLRFFTLERHSRKAATISMKTGNNNRMEQFGQSTEHSRRTVRARD